MNKLNEKFYVCYMSLITTLHCASENTSANRRVLLYFTFSNPLYHGLAPAP